MENTAGTENVTGTSARRFTTRDRIFKAIIPKATLITVKLISNGDRIFKTVISQPVSM